MTPLAGLFYRLFGLCFHLRVRILENARGPPGTGFGAAIPAPRAFVGLETLALPHRVRSRPAS